MTSGIFGNSDKSDSDRLFRIWESERRTRDLNVKLMWENMKYFGSLISALITASVTLIGINFDRHTHILFPILIIILQVFTIFLAQYAKNDLEERRKRFFLVVSHLLKLEILLGFYDPIDQKLKDTRFEDDQHLFAQYEKNLCRLEVKGKQDTDKFIEDKMREKKNNSYSIMSNVYPLMQITMLGFIIAEIIILGYAKFLISLIL